MPPILAKIITVIVNPLLEVLFGIAFIIFLWGVLEFIMNAEDADKRKEGASNIFWGLVGLFVMVSAIALLHVVKNTVGV